MLDSHCHLADEAFGDDLPEVVARARDAGLDTALCILAAGDADESARAATLRDLWPEVQFACGVHPHQAAAWAGREHEAAGFVRDLVERDASVRAIGEIGLDYHYDFAPRPVQRGVFAAQVALATELARPIVIHTREADADTWAVLRDADGPLRGIVHCFTGDADAARDALALGLHISFSGIVTFPRADALREIAASVPLDRLLVETDAPYLAPVPHRGGRNEPAWVAEVVGVVARARATEPHLIASAAERNFGSLMAEK
ncbi:MAG: TatD family hydrolase [Vicinamibacterales bacterium]|jgi:TatD DNase family protein|nr:hydrolase TatD [Acidobacteriota bacterium]MDP7295046.1 TatD family hydrolase [Vicinamibacterales bacterium]MDP7671563.1 TatD family hydrolase [Vicinamibacterales bacterium]HJO38388.1 TatD family hydrolase [Vicinamibacterales bacterium]|tara:strand:+ start:233 stop:1012 length:780 start_codon:yes stop_codon:yes gene_type:complete